MRFAPGEWESICERFGGACYYCGSRRRLVQEHVEPLSRGGADDLSNIVPSCLSCNSSKSDLLLLEWVCVQNWLLVRFGMGSQRNLRTYESWSEERHRELDERDRQRFIRARARRPKAKVWREQQFGFDTLVVVGQGGRVEVDVADVLAALAEPDAEGEGAA